MGRRGCPPEFRRKVLDLLDAGRAVGDVARDLEISSASIYTWRRQDCIARGAIPRAEQRGEVRADRCEEAHRRTRGRGGDPSAASERLGEGDAPKRRFEAIAVMAARGHAVQVATRVLGASDSGFYAWRIGDD
ncbi:transposase [Cellulomonas palmilytica]|uniref:transposase n=1 Tax=Cellulomonas palmilytica TaxID=2608402 RepID=UPI001F377C00|nr:transposase [Cellulomonas palmilytica]UJP40990.1 transposase [Cellulomonas palmilytica]